MDVKIAGLFAGIGGLDMGVAEGLEEYGFAVEHAALVEREREAEEAERVLREAQG